MRASLSQYGLTDPKITAVRVDDKLILVADTDKDANSGNDNGNLLVAPTDDVIEMDDEYITLTAGTSRGKSHLFTFAVVSGSTIGFIIATILT